MAVETYKTQYGDVYRCIGCCKDDYENITTSRNYRKASGVIKWRPRTVAISGQRPMLKAIREVEAGLGKEIVVTGSLRTCALQAQLYARDPKRYAPPSVGVHCQGLAIDVNTEWRDSLTANEELRFKGLMKHNGFHQARPDEPWHFSYEVTA